MRAEGLILTLGNKNPLKERNGEGDIDSLEKSILLTIPDC
jgi:hypothetical protein